MLMENKEKIVSRDDLMAKIWENDDYIDENTLSVNVNRLRKKLSGIGLDDFIITKKGLGYKLGQCYTMKIRMPNLQKNGNVKAFTSIKQGDYLETEYDSKLRRINIFANGTIIGYIGVPNIDKFGNYDMVNQGWKYNIHAENGQVISPLKDALQKLSRALSLVTLPSK